MALSAGEEIRAGIVTDEDGRQVISVDTVTVTGDLTVSNEVEVINTTAVPVDVTNATPIAVDAEITNASPIDVSATGSVEVTNDSSKTTVGASALTVERGFANTAASATDSEVIAAVATKKIRVLALVTSATGTASSLTFGSASTAIAATVKAGASFPYNPHGWFETAAGEALNVTTGTGSTTGIQVTYVEV